MNKTEILTITLVIISLFLNWYNISSNNTDINDIHDKINYALSEHNNIEVRMNDLEKEIEENTVTLEEWEWLAEYILDIEDVLYNLIETHDDNVELYNRQIRENTRAINDVIDYLR